MSGRSLSLPGGMQQQPQIPVIAIKEVALNLAVQSFQREADEGVSTQTITTRADKFVDWLIAPVEGPGVS